MMAHVRELVFKFQELNLNFVWVLRFGGSWKRYFQTLLLILTMIPRKRKRATIFRGLSELFLVFEIPRRVSESIRNAQEAVFNPHNDSEREREKLAFRGFYELRFHIEFSPPV